MVIITAVIVVNRIGDNHRFAKFFITFFVATLFAFGVYVTYGVKKEVQQETQAETRIQTETVVVKGVTRNVRSGYIVINGEYKVKTTVDIPRGSTITIEKKATDYFYKLIEYEIK